MAEGVRSTNLPSTAAVAELIGNRDAGGGTMETVRVPVDDIATAMGLATVASTGDYADLDGLPTLGSLAAETPPGGTTTFLRADGAWAAPSSTSAVGSVVQSVISTYSTTADLTVAIPADSTIPQSTEGTQVLSASITPTNASNILLVDVLCHLYAQSGYAAIAALFRDSGVNAVAAAVGGQDALYGPAVIRYRVAAGSVSATTFKVRAGPGGGTGGINRFTASATLGGVLISSLRITEIKG